MVKRNLAKVETAGPSPVVRSQIRLAEAIRPVGTQTRAVGAEVAHFPDSEGVTSSNLVSPTEAEVHFGVHWVIGAAASALPSHGRGRRFDSYITHGRYGGRFSGLWRSW